MKSFSDQDRRALNTPQQMRLRLARLFQLGLAVAVVLCVFVGIIRHAVAPLLASVPAGLLSYALRRVVRSAPEADVGAASVDAMFGSAIAEMHDDHIGQLVSLLDEWNRLEGARGSEAFDMWELRSVQHQIRRLVRSDPFLARLFEVGPRSDQTLR